MSNEAKTGGPAFPYSYEYTDVPEFYPAQPKIYPVQTATVSYPGMTLRDYFAAKAMAAMGPLQSSAKSYREAEMKGRAIEAYLMADAMIAARGEA